MVLPTSRGGADRRLGDEDDPVVGTGRHGEIGIEHDPVGIDRHLAGAAPKRIVDIGLDEGAGGHEVGLCSLRRFGGGDRRRGRGGVPGIRHDAPAHNRTDDGADARKAPTTRSRLFTTGPASAGVWGIVATDSRSFWIELAARGTSTAMTTRGYRTSSGPIVRRESERSGYSFSRKRGEPATRTFTSVPKTTSQKPLVTPKLPISSKW